jgi:amidase
MKFILSCAGPLSSDLSGIETFFRSVFDAQPARYDSTIIDIPWRQVPTKPTLRIGVVPESSIFPLHPPIRRVLAEAIHLLKAHGHHILYLDEKDCRLMEANEIAWNFFTLDQASKKHLESAGEPPVPAIFYMLKQGEKLRQFYKRSLPDMTTLDQLEKVALLNTRRAELRETYRRLWLQHNLDVCIAPPAQTTAVPHDTFGLAPYTTLTNLLDVGYLSRRCSELCISDFDFHHSIHPLSYPLGK